MHQSVPTNKSQDKKTQILSPSGRSTKKVQFANISSEVLQQKIQQQSIKLMQSKSNKQSNQLSSIFTSKNAKQEVKNISQLQQFAEAWKSQSNFSILLIEKLSLIVNNYFKMLSQMVQRNQEIETLIVYNKGLIEILTKFEDQQRKLIHKLKTLEQFNIKIMKQLCALKKRSFDPPQAKGQQSIFTKFSLKNLKYERPLKSANKEDQNYKNKIQKLFKQYLLQKNDQYIPIIQQKITECQSVNQKKLSLQAENKIQQLKQLLEDVITYNKKLDNINYENMFDLYEMKWDIKTQMKNLNIQILENNQDIQKKEKMFVDSIKKIHANLSNLNQNQLQNYLKKEKQIRKKVKRQRVKEQQIFLRTCQQAQSQNFELKIDNTKLKEKIFKLEQQLSKIKAQMQFNWMKTKKSNKSMIDQSILIEGETSRLMVPKKSRADSEVLKKLKDQNQKLNKFIEDRKFEQFQQKRKIIQKIKQHEVSMPQTSSYEQIFNAVLQNYKNLKIKADYLLQKQSDLLSPKIGEDKSFQLAPPLDKSIIQKKPRNQTKQDDKQLEQLRRRNAELEKKQQYIKKLQSQLKKENKITDQKASAEEQLLKNIEKLKKIQIQLGKKEAQLAKKNTRVKQVQKQLEMLKLESIGLRQRSKQLQFLNQSAQKLTQNVVKAVQTLVTQDFNEQKFLVLMDNMFENLQKYVKQYKLQTKKQIQLNPFPNNENPTFQKGREQTNKRLFKNKFKPRQSTKVKTVDIGVNVSIQIENKPSSNNSLNRSQIKQSKSKIRQNQNKFGQSQQNSLNKAIDKSSQKYFNKVGEKNQMKMSVQNAGSNSVKIGLQKQQQIYTNMKSNSSQNSIQGKSNNNKNKYQFQSQVKIQTQASQIQNNRKSNQSKKNLTKFEQNKDIDKLKTSNASKYDPFLSNIQKTQKITILNNQSKKQPNKSPSLSNQKIKNGQLKASTKSKNNESHNYHKVQSNLLEQIQQENASNQEINIRINAPTVLPTSGTAQSLSTASKSEKTRKSLQKKQKKYRNSHKPQSSKQPFNQNKYQKILQQKQSSNNEHLNSAIFNKSKPPEMSEVNLSYSEQEAILTNSIYLAPNSHLTPHVPKSNNYGNYNNPNSHHNYSHHTNNSNNNNNNNSNSKKNSSHNKLDKSALDVGIQLGYIQKMQQKFKRLHNDDDALDFYQLFHRYKQALKCLETSQKINRLHEIRYNKFINQILEEQENNPSYNIQEQLFNLSKSVLQQQKLLKQQKEQFENSFIQHIKTSEKNIKQQLKFMREEYLKKNPNKK